MSIALTAEHRALADSVRGWTSRHATPEVARAVMDGGAVDEVWIALVDQGLLGLHVPEEHGGAGYGLPELAVVAEELGRACTPGPWLPTVAASAVITLLGDDQLGKEFLPGLADGSLKGCVGFDEVVLGAPDADVAVLVVDGTATVWTRDQITVATLPSFDATRSLGRVTTTGTGRPLDASADQVRDVVATVLAAEAAGIAGWCLDTAVEYAKVREQFGRPIGQFQGVKHLAAEMLAKVEMMRAAAWDAAQVADDDEQRPLAAAVAAGTAFDPAVEVAKDCIQVLGGIGFTWEHDAHLYLKRATAVRALIGGTRDWRRRVTGILEQGTRRTLDLTLEGDEAEAARAETRAFIEGLPDDERARDQAIANAGYAMPHWPTPYGRDASAVQQLVIDEEFARAGVKRRNMVIGGWILPTIIEYGTDAQREQFMLPTLCGDVTWAQMFSEPGAGSDLAALSTKAVKVDGGWVLNGQKVWTTLAHKADWALVIARTNPDAPKHDGITAFLLDMNAEGIDIRPLREITGNELFNEIFLNDVFIGDDMVCGPVDGGWKAARTTLSNERVAMSKGSAMGTTVEGVLATAQQTGAIDDDLVRDEIGRLAVEGQVLGILGYRSTLAALSGTDPGAASSIRKLVGGENSKDCAELVMQLLGPLAASTADAAERATFMFVQAQCLTIAGGTTNVQKNVIAERLLGLPRDP